MHKQSKRSRLESELETARVNAKYEEREFLRSQSEQRKMPQEHYSRQAQQLVGALKNTRQSRGLNTMSAWA